MSLPKFIANIINLPQAKLLLGYSKFAQDQAPKVGVWGVPLIVFAGWMIAPALTDNFRTSIGLPALAPKTFPIAKWKTEEVDKPPTRAV